MLPCVMQQGRKTIGMMDQIQDLISYYKIL